MVDLAGARWIKSTWSMGSGNCVEVAHFPDCAAVRDSKDKAGPVLIVGSADWQEFLYGVKAGQFDLPG
ncbi:MAG TPA: DUF397 domain-containing protein [Streptosporangiaceae bacterium]